jgi:hypothetical protein
MHSETSESFADSGGMDAIGVGQQNIIFFSELQS